MSKSDEESGGEVRLTPNEGFEKSSLADGMAQVQGVVPHEQEFYLDHSGGFVAYDKGDKWRSISYDKRYLDALASVLLISHDTNPVAAITQVGDTYYLAYNDARKSNFKQSYENKLQEILKCFNARDWKTLLALHILYNKVDFLDKVDSYKFPQNLIKESPLGKIQGLKLELRQKTINVDTIKKEVIGLEKQLKSIISDVVPEVVLLLTSAPIRSIYELYGNLVASLPPGDQELIYLILRPLQNVVKLASYIENKLPRLKLVSTENLMFIDDITAKIEGVDIVHAEVRLVHFVKKTHPDTWPYIGSSRLCCAGCHKVLDDGGYEHRGTSGVFFSKWRCFDKSIPGKLIISAIDYAKEKPLLSQETEYTSRTGSMQRDLSEDQDYETLEIERMNLLGIKKALGISIVCEQKGAEEEKIEKDEFVMGETGAVVAVYAEDTSLSGESAETSESDE